MAYASPSPLASSVEKTNGAKLSRLLIDGGTTLLRKVFDGYHPPANLAADLNACYSILNNLLRRRILNGHQWHKLFPPSGVAPDSNTFDITLLFLLLTNICGLSPPPTGWHTKPPASDTSLEANLARIKFFRNVLYGHVTTTGVDTPTFTALWLEISAVLVALGFDQTEIDKLKAERGGEEDYLDALREWAGSEEDIKSQLKNIHQTQTTTQQTVEEVRQTQIEDHEALQDSKSKLEEVRHTQTKTQQTVEDVRQTQTKTQQTVEEVAVGLQEVKEAVENIKGERDKDKADEVLRNLAKSEFKGDIEYYVKRFQAGTREWVFNRVQDWLDDRSSQNRVMVISGNAGMGKSVISAVICKRMQEAGRLSGSHFCQHNNVRYRNPQLMLQSLACHLSHALLEYKQALVTQLSRNLGNELNSMDVEELFALLFKEPLSGVDDPGRNMLMVIDGLDESEYQGRNELLDIIANQFCKLPSWIRFVVTTRPATNITEKLKHLQPFQLESNDERNVDDIRAVLQKRLQLVTKPVNGDAVVEKLVMKTEGLMLYAYFLILYIEENPFVLDQEDLDDSFPLGICSVYHSFFKRLEDELMKELDVKEASFLNLLCAITASREPLPTGLVSKVLSADSSSPISKRKILKAISSVSTLLPISDGCLHVIHKSVKDWLTDISYCGEHEFIMDEKEGHRILAKLCSDELDGIKRKGVGLHDTQFSATEKYALHHGARHMFYSLKEKTPRRLEELTNAYIVDLEHVFAKLCVNNTTAAEDLLWLQREGILIVLSQDIQSIVDALLFLLRKHHHRFTTHPHIFLQTMLNEGGTVLSAKASNLLQTKYRGIPYMEYMHKETPRGGVMARFQCSSKVACVDVSPNLDYLVCECANGVLNLWSLRTGRLLWERPVKVTKSYQGAPLRESRLAECRRFDAILFYRSVAFHPTQELVLPGILSHTYTVDGDLKPQFPESNCRFSVCSISGDKTKILTDCPEDAKCLVMWSLKNGSEIVRIYRSDHVLSFAWSRDGRLIAISQCTGLICLVDAMNDFRTLAQTTTPEVCGVVKFSPDHRVLFCFHSSGDSLLQFRFNVMDNHHTFLIDVCSAEVSYDHGEFQSFSDCGFLLGDPFPLSGSFLEFKFVLNKQTLLSFSPLSSSITMLNTSEQTRNSQSTTATVQRIALSLNGQTAYLVNYSPVATVMALDVSSGELIAEKKTGTTGNTYLVPVKEGVLLSTYSGTLELWNFDLSESVRSWSNIPLLTKVIPISEQRVACVTKEDEVNVLDTTSAEIVSTITGLQGEVIACNRKGQILIIDYSRLAIVAQLLDGTTLLWEKNLADLYSYLPSGILDAVGEFSPDEHYVVICHNFPHRVLVLDAVSGNILSTWSDFTWAYDCKVVSDEECVISCGASLSLFNIKSGDMLSVIDVEGEVTCLAACPSNCFIAVGLWNSTSGFKVIRVCLPGDKHNRKNKR